MSSWCPSHHHRQKHRPGAEPSHLQPPAPGLGAGLCRDRTARRSQFAGGSLYWYQGELRTHPGLAWHRFFCSSVCPALLLWCLTVMLGTRLQHAETWSMSSLSRCSCSTKDCAMNQMVLLIHPIPTSTCESSVHPGLFTDEKFIFNKYWLKISVNVIQISEALGPKLVWMWKIS